MTVVGDKAVNEKWDKKTTLPLGPIGSYNRTLSFKYIGKDTEKKELDKVEVTAKLLSSTLSQY